MTWEFVFEVLKSLSITAATSALTGIIVYAKQRRKADKQHEELEAERERALQDALCRLLRAQIVAIHDVYVGRGYCPTHVKEILQSVYDAYTGYKGNGIGKKMYEETMRLPDERRSE